MAATLASPYTRIWLSAEEAFLWRIVCDWRTLNATSAIAVPPTLDWDQLVALTTKNKLSILFGDAIDTLGLRGQMTASAREQLESAEARNREKAANLSNVLHDYMALANSENVPTIPLKGLWVSDRIYQNPEMRPGHDLDLLTVSADTRRCIALCEQLGFDRFWPGLLPDDYYMRHHLHLELSLNDCWTWIEIHWAFDHPRTLLTIDYDAMFARSQKANLLGATIWEPNWVDTLMSLSVHLVKHAVYLPVILDHPRLLRILMADKHLMHSLDIAEIVKQFGDEIDWNLLIKVGRQSGATLILATVLRMVRDLFDAPVPRQVIEQLNPPTLPRWQHTLFAATAEHILAKAEGRPQRGIWNLLLEPNWKFVFRPIRLLDYVAYLFPPNDYLDRAYGSHALPRRLRHSFGAIGIYLRLAYDTIHDSIQVARNPLTPKGKLPADSKCHGATA